MKNKFTLFSLILAIFISGNVLSSNNEFTELTTFKDNKGYILGKAYVHYVDTNVFDYLKITKNTNKHEVILYTVDKTKFISPKGIETEVYPTGFYGYEVIMIKNNYLVISYLRNQGNNVSDDITIEWNEDLKQFGILKAP